MMKKSINQQYKPRQFKIGEDCPLCNGKLIDISKGGLLASKIVLRCSNDECYFNAEIKDKADDVGYSCRYLDEEWSIYLSMTKEKHSMDAINEAKESMKRILFPKGLESAKVKTKTQFICPFTGKRFGSMDALVKSAIPILIKSSEANLSRKRAEETKKEELLKADQRRQQLIDDEKFPTLRKR